jgi:hypothetical protein
MKVLIQKVLTGMHDTVSTVTSIVSSPMPPSFELTTSLHWFRVFNCNREETR